MDKKSCLQIVGFQTPYKFRTLTVGCQAVVQLGGLLLGWSQIFKTKNATQTCTICRRVWNLPHQFHLYLIFWIPYGALDLWAIWSGSRKLSFRKRRKFWFPFSPIPAEGKTVVLPSAFNLSIDYWLSTWDWTRPATL